MREGLFLNHRIDSVTVVGASLGGLVQGEKILGPVPQGYAWYVENIACVVKGNSHSAACWLAETIDDGPLGGPAGGLVAWDGQGALTLLSPAIANWWSATPNYVGPGHFLHALVSAAQSGTFAAGDVATVTMQIAVHQLDPHYMMSREDAVQVQDAHERTAAELNRDAVGARAV